LAPPDLIDLDTEKRLAPPGLFDPHTEKRLAPPMLENRRIFPEKLMRIAPDSILKLGGSEKRQVPGEGRPGLGRCEGRGRGFGNHDGREIHDRRGEPNGRSPGGNGHQRRHRQYGAKGGSTSQGRPGVGTLVVPAEEATVQSRMKVPWDVQRRQTPQKLDPALEGTGVSPASLTRGSVPLHFSCSFVVEIPVEEIRETSQELLAIHRLHDTPSILLGLMGTVKAHLSLFYRYAGNSLTFAPHLRFPDRRHLFRERNRRRKDGEKRSEESRTAVGEGPRQDIGRERGPVRDG
jgi:hypothetical protein